VSKIYRGVREGGKLRVEQRWHPSEGWQPLPLFCPDDLGQLALLADEPGYPGAEVIAYSLIVDVSESHQIALQNYRGLLAIIERRLVHDVWEISEEQVWESVHILII
jgi:hypothetical protein